MSSKRRRLVSRLDWLQDRLGNDMAGIVESYASRRCERCGQSDHGGTFLIERLCYKCMHCRLCEFELDPDEKIMCIDCMDEMIGINGPYMVSRMTGRIISRHNALGRNTSSSTQADRQP